MTRFTSDNTEGYTAAELAILNERFDARMERDAELADSDLVPNRESYADHIAETVLALYDAQRASGFAAA